jgi:beta-mannosidase
MITEILDSGWTARALSGDIPAHIADRDIPAQVPGSIHTDLLASNLIDDPYLGMEENELKWLHTSAWRYTTRFTAAALAPGEHADLTFDGLDTVARIVLNGTELARTYNQHRTYRFDVTHALREGDNVLEIEFSSAIEYAWDQEKQLGHRPRSYENPMNMVRKMACSFGWDWGPDLQTVGIWKQVRLERWRVVRATQTRTLATVLEDGTGRVEVHLDLDWRAPHIDDDHPAVTLHAQISGGHQPVEATVSVALGAPTAVIVIDVPEAPLWWPVGYGEHPLSDLTVTLHNHAAEVGRYERRIGFRTVELNTQPDQYGTPFTLRINGRDIFIKGANWIPNDHLLTRITREHLEARADQALVANMNLLRVWGGGIYETDDFYDVCDERGILVWQDFLLACAAYPEEAPFWQEFEAEARDIVARLSSHASLVIWNGGNENLWGFMDWGWPKDLEGRTWGLGLYTDLFRSVLAELDPTRPYSDGSPYSPGFTAELEGGTTQAHPNDQHHGTRHEWDVWNRQDYLTHLEYVPRFCSEFGHQGPPTWSTLTRSISPSGRSQESAEFLLHQKAGDGNIKLDKGAAPHLPMPQDFEEWNWVTQLAQAHSVSFGIEHFRSFWPYTAGTVVWQLNDCWPVTSWAAVDGDGREKPLFHALRHAHAPRLLTFKPRAASTDVRVVSAGEHGVGDTAGVANSGVARSGADDSALHRAAAGIGPVVGAGAGAVPAALGAGFGEDLPHGRGVLGEVNLFVHNDTDEPWSGDVEFTRTTFAGDLLATERVAVTADARAVARVTVPADLLAVDDAGTEVLVANLDGERALHYFEEFKNLALEPHPFEASVFERDGQVVVAVRATGLVADLAIMADRIHPSLTVNDQLVTLLAGEEAEFVLQPYAAGATGAVQGFEELATNDVLAAVQEALADPEREHVLVRAINTIRV